MLVHTKIDVRRKSSRGFNVEKQAKPEKYFPMFSGENFMRSLYSFDGSSRNDGHGSCLIVGDATRSGIDNFFTTRRVMARVLGIWKNRTATCARSDRKI